MSPKHTIMEVVSVLYKWTQEGKEFMYLMNLLRNEARMLVEKRISKLSDKVKDPNLNNSIRPALIDVLISDHRENPKDTTLDDIVGEVTIFLIAGWDMTTWTASYSLLMLGLYPEVQDKVHQEIFSTVRNIDEISMAELMKLKYMECVINESMRLFPLITFHGRRAEIDIEVMIDGKIVTIPRGTEIGFVSELLHRNPRYWNDPDKFIPERFLPENSKSRDPYAFIPFSAGPRNCIGKAFGMIEDKIIITHILSSFKVKSLDPVDKIRMNSTGIARRTYEPLRFEFHPREPMEQNFT